MSTRYLKKVLLEEEELKLKLKNQQQQLNKESDSEEESGPPPSSQNLFHLLNHDDDDDDDLHDDIDDDHVQEENHIEEDTSLTNHHTSEIPSSNLKSNKKKKKKKKKKNTTNALADKDDDDEEDFFLENLSLREKSSSSSIQQPTVLQNQCSILQVDPKHLSAENELKRIFGSKVVTSFENSTNQPGTSRQQMRGVRSHTHKKTILVSPSDHWHRWDGSLSMELLETRDGNHYFRYVHSSSYRQAQREFETAKAMNDLDSIGALLGYHPYHLESLLTLAEYYKLVGEHQRASDFITKCLYALECAWHPMFTPLQGNCKLKYCHETNQPLFTTLFIHMRNLDRRGCHRCALEMCKVLLSLDSDDAKGAMHCIDYFALRAEQYTWLERFSEEYNSGDTSIWLFPNFSYSLAVSRFYNEQKSDLSEGSKANSSELMKQALMLHPFILKKLVGKVPLKDQYWTGVLKHDHFKSDQSGSPSLDHLSDIYAERSYLIWRLPDLQNLLKASVMLVIETLKTNSSEARDWACMRKETFPSKKNEYTHLLVSDFSDSKPSTLPENLQQLMVDPAGGERVAVANPPRDDRRRPREVANRNAVTVLLESILPWNNFGGREDHQANEED